MRWPAADVADWTHNTMEQARIQTRQMEMYTTVIPLHNVTQVHADSVPLSCIYTDRTHDLPCGTSIPVTMREATDALFAALTEQDGIWKCLMRIGDCLAPGTTAAAAYSGHQLASAFGEPENQGVLFKREPLSLAVG